MAFSLQDIEDGCNCGIYEEIGQKKSEELRSNGFMLSSSFVVWQQDSDGNEKGRFVINFS